MASRISQMRNAQLQPQQQVRQQPQLPSNEDIMRTKALMTQMQNSPNMEVAIMNLLQSNSQLGQIVPLLRNGNSLEGIAKSIASMKNIDINQLIQELSGGNKNEYN